MTGDGSPPPACPYCGSRDTDLSSLFGAQLLTAEYYCRSCRTPFQRVRGDDVVEDAARHVKQGESA